MKRSTFIVILILMICLCGISVKKYREDAAARELAAAATPAPSPTPEPPILRPYWPTPTPTAAPQETGEIAALEPVASAAPAGERSAPAAERTYILNTSSGKFHFPSCSGVKQMKDYNKQEFTGTRDAVIAMGYEPCGICHP